MAMTSEQEARARGLDLAVRYVLTSRAGLPGEHDRTMVEPLADEFANYIVGYDIKAQAEINKNAGKGY